jgi:hypothetical protein
VNETTENFWAAWALPQEPPKPAFYRLYYDEQGYLLFYSMEDVPGNYIEIDQITFAAGSPRVRVVNGRLLHINTHVVSKLVPSSQGQACDIRDVAVISNDKENTQYWKLKATDESS